MSTHLTRPLYGCRLRDCGAPDCPTCMGASAARQYLAELAEQDNADDEPQTEPPHENPQRTHPQFHPQPEPRPRCPIQQTPRRDLR